MIYFEPAGGLCNRLWSLQSALALAKKYKRDITILWGKKPYLLDAYFTDLFEPIESKDFDIKMIQSSRYVNYILRKWILPIKCKNVVSGEYTGFLVSSYYHAHSGVMDDDIAMMQKNGSITIPPLFDGLVEIYKQHSLISSCIPFYPNKDGYDFLVPVKDIQEKVASLIKEPKNTIGLHIRTYSKKMEKDYTSQENTDISSFIEIIQTTLEQESNIRFYLASDSQEVKNTLLNKFGDKIIYNDYRIARSSVNDMKAAVVDLFCLSKTKKIYGTRGSSFTYVAADIGRIPKIIL